MKKELKRFVKLTNGRIVDQQEVGPLRLSPKHNYVLLTSGNALGKYAADADDYKEDMQMETPKKKNLSEEQQLKYLLNKEKCCPLDKDELYELQNLVNKYGYPNYK